MLNDQLDNRVERALYLLFWGVAGVCACVYLLRPIVDPDFWWHLKTGELIWQGRGLLAGDPLSYTSPPVATSREEFILNGYWLWQLAYAAGYRLGGFAGITLLNGAILAAILASIARRMLRGGAAPALTCLVVAAVLFLLPRHYLLERPQIFSFLCASLLMGLIEAARRDDRPPWLLLPLMVVWANCHGGVVVGDILLALVGLTALLDCRGDSARRNRLMAWAALGILASFVSPNGYRFIRELAAPDSAIMYEYVIEYRSLFWWYANRDRAILFLLLLMGLHALLLARYRNNWFALAAFLVITVLSLRHMRVAGFYVTAILPGLAMLLPSAGTLVRRATLPALLAAIGLLAGGGGLEYKQNGLNVSPRWNVFPWNFPVAAADFLEREAAIQGRMFNDYAPGGYLAWRLHPAYRTFIDSRCLSFELFDDYVAAINAEPKGDRPRYQTIFEQYRIDYVIQRHQADNGELKKIFKGLLADPGWVPVYLDEAFYIVVKDNGRNDAVLKKYGAGKREYLLALYRIYSRTIHRERANFKNYLTRADILIQLGRPAEAKRDVQTALQLAPGNLTAGRMMSRLSKYP